MNAKNRIFKASLVILLVFLALFTVSNTYAYWQDLGSFNTTSNNNLSIGKWYHSKQYQTGFESYNNKNYVTTQDVNFDGVLWDVSNVMTATSSDDSYYDSRGLRLKNTAYLMSSESFYGVESISFYIGDTRGGLFGLGTSNYNVQISSDGINFDTIYSGNASTSFQLVNIDVEDLLTDGYTLSNGVTVDLESNLYIKINFQGWGLLTDRLVNLDNLTVDYRSLLR
ncbi:MAG: hypothetical protein WC152_05885 [Candidatus Izemoplasmatales bacterium]